MRPWGLLSGQFGALVDVRNAGCRVIASLLSLIIGQSPIENTKHLIFQPVCRVRNMTIKGRKPFLI